MIGWRDELCADVFVCDGDNAAGVAGGECPAESKGTRKVNSAGVPGVRGGASAVCTVLQAVWEEVLEGAGSTVHHGAGGLNWEDEL